MTANSSMHPFLPYGKQTIEADDIEAVTQALQGDFLTTGPTIGEFETALAARVGAKEAVAVGNGTQALHLACLAAGLGAGDYAIVPSLTFLATANAVRYCGADVIFCDVDAETGLIDLTHLKQLLETHKDKSIKAVLPVHLAGRMADLKAIKDLSNHYHFTIIADTCHALGSKHNGYAAGSCDGLEDMGVFSFHPVKTIAMGEGGAITVSNSDLANKMRLWRSHAMEKNPEIGAWAYDMKELGYNYRVTDIQCALGLSQIKKLDRFIEKRQALVALYNQLLAPLAPHILPPAPAQEQDPAWHLYAIRMDFEALGLSRDQVMKALAAENVGTQVHYIPVHTQPYYTDLYGQTALKGAQAYYQRTLSLPLFPLMEEHDVHYVVKTLTKVCGL